MDSAPRVELPYTEVRSLLGATAAMLGCPDFECEVIGQTAWHLANRGLDGVDYVIRYLALLATDQTINRFAISLIAVDMSDKLNSGDRRVSAFTGIPAPLMLLPAASFNLEKDAVDDGILFSFYDQTVVYSKTHGLRIESTNPEGLFHIDTLNPPTCTASRVDFTEGAGHGIEFPRQRLETLSIPKPLYTGGSTIRLAPLLG